MTEADSRNRAGAAAGRTGAGAAAPTGAEAAAAGAAAGALIGREGEHEFTVRAELAFVGDEGLHAGERFAHIIVGPEGADDRVDVLAVLGVVTGGDLDATGPVVGGAQVACPLQQRVERGSGYGVSAAGLAELGGELVLTATDGCPAGVLAREACFDVGEGLLHEQDRCLSASQLGLEGGCVGHRKSPPSSS